MRKGTGEFKKVEVYKTVCDECGQDVKIENQIHWDAHWSDGYDRYGDDFDFCSVECMMNHFRKDFPMTFPPDNEDVTLEIPSKFLKGLLYKLE